jgi:hypothetical protein
MEREREREAGRIDVSVPLYLKWTVGYSALNALDILGNWQHVFFSRLIAHFDFPREICFLTQSKHLFSYLYGLNAS